MIDRIMSQTSCAPNLPASFKLSSQSSLELSRSDQKLAPTKVSEFLKPIGSKYLQQSSLRCSVIETGPSPPVHSQSIGYNIDQYNDRQHEAFSYTTQGDHVDAARTWDMIVAQSIEQPTAANNVVVRAAANHSPQQAHNYISHKMVASGLDDEQLTNTASGNNQSQKYNFQYQDEMSRMRERLFRLLSKVPIHVETEPVGCGLTADASSVSPSSSSSSSSSSTSKQQSSKLPKSQHCKFIDREPLIIKYYNDRTLPELIEQHFGCSLIKHNYNNREPLMNQMEIVFGKRISPSDHRCRQQQATNNRRHDNSQAKINVSDEQVWSMAQFNHSTPGSIGAPNQLKSWYHLSMDNSVNGRSSRRSSIKVVQISPRQHQKQLQRNGCSDVPANSQAKAKNHGKYHQQTTAKTIRRPSSSASHYPTQGSTNAHGDRQIYQQAPALPRQVSFIAQMPDGMNMNQQQYAPENHQQANYPDSTIAGYHHQSTITSIDQNGQAIYEHANGGAWPNGFDGQLLNDVIQQQQQYTDTYYTIGQQYVNQQQQPSHLMAGVDEWHAPNNHQQQHHHQHILMDEPGIETRTHMIDQQQQQFSSETSINSSNNNINGSFDCLAMATSPTAIATTALYLPMSAAAAVANQSHYTIGHMGQTHDRHHHHQLVQYQPPVEITPGQTSHSSSADSI